MNRRQVIFALAALASGSAWPQGKPRRIGVLVSTRSNDAEIQARMKILEDELARLGWKKGSNLVIDYQFAEGDSSRLVPLAKQLSDGRSELVVAAAESAATALRQVTLSLPIIFLQVPDPVAAGFVTTLSHPEGNITGFTNMDASVASKWLQSLKECAPKTAQVAVVFDPINPAWRSYVRGVEVANRSAAVKLSPIAASTPAELEAGIDQFAKVANGALVILPGASTTNYRTLIIGLAARHRLPAIYPYSFHAVNGGLMAYGVDLPDVYRGAASYVDRILKGAKPGDLPVQQPTRFEFVVNLKTAKALGITIPPSLLQSADRVIN